MKMITVLHFRTRALPPTATAQQKGAYVDRATGGIRFFTKPAVRRAETTWAGILRPAREVFGPALAGPVDARFDFVWPYTAATPKRTRALGEWIPHDRRPDLDNILKALLDTMTAMQFWADDGQLCGIDARKWRGPEAVVELSLSVPDYGPGFFDRQPVELDLTTTNANQQ
jgi:Holliday junction resolvase RusA-like endonuclease